MKVRRPWPAGKPHRVMVFWLTEAKVRPSGLKVTNSPAPSAVSCLPVATSHSMIPFVPPEASNRPSGLNATDAKRSFFEVTVCVDDSARGSVADLDRLSGDRGQPSPISTDNKASLDTREPAKSVAGLWVQQFHAISIRSEESAVRTKRDACTCAIIGFPKFPAAFYCPHPEYVRVGHVAGPGSLKINSGQQEPIGAKGNRINNSA